MRRFVVASVSLAAPAFAQNTCQPDWSDQFGPAALNGLVRTLLPADLGHGPAL
jgi:hypothetical protein